MQENATRRDDMGSAEDLETLRKQHRDLEARIDGLALLAFDVYTKRREKLQDIRVDEVKRRISGVMRKSGLSGDSL